MVGSGDTVVIIGGGPVGIIHCRLARAKNAGKVILVEREIKRLEKVDLSAMDKVIDSAGGDVESEIMALTDGRGADVIIVACSAAKAQEQSLSLAAMTAISFTTARFRCRAHTVHCRRITDKLSICWGGGC